jgi:GT2 family glycosyltransferase
MNIGFVFTNYNNSTFSLKLIKSLQNALQNNCQYFIVIVDNNSSIEEKKILYNNFSNSLNIKILFEPDNHGYFSGLNIGIKYLRINYQEISHIIIGNNDLEFDISFYKQLINSFHLFNDYPVISPNIISSDGFHQNPHVITKISRFRELVYNVFYSYYFLSKIILSISKFTKGFTDRKDELEHGTAREIYQGHGSCYILGPLFFNNFDKLFAPTFLMFEEFFLSYQLNQKFYKIFYTPDIVIKHYSHSTIQTIPSKYIWKISKESYKIYKKYLKIYNVRN